MSLQKKILNIVICLSTLSILNACGAPSAAKPKTSSASLAAFSEEMMTENLSFGDFTCGGTNNIIPYTGVMGAGSFRGCAASSTTEKVLVRGTTNYDSVICAFPYQYIDAQHVYFKPGQNGLPMFDCQDITQGSGATFEFKYTSFNGLFIVEYSNLTKMQNCVNNNNLVACDSLFSSGTFRKN